MSSRATAVRFERKNGLFRFFRIETNALVPFHCRVPSNLQTEPFVTKERGPFAVLSVFAMQYRGAVAQQGVA